MRDVYSCPPCKDSSTVLVRRHAPEHPDATRSGWVLEWRPCPARPCRAPVDEAAEVTPEDWERLRAYTAAHPPDSRLEVVQGRPHPSGEIFPRTRAGEDPAPH